MAEYGFEDYEEENYQSLESFKYYMEILLDEFGNSVFDYTKKADEIKEIIKNYYILTDIGINISSENFEKELNALIFASFSKILDGYIRCGKIYNRVIKDKKN